MRGGTYATSATLQPLVGGVFLRLSDCEANRGNGLGCVSQRILRLYARWRSSWQETVLRRSDCMLSLTRAWPSSLELRAWGGCRTIHLYQELSLGGGSAHRPTPPPCLLIARPPSPTGHHRDPRSAKFNLTPMVLQPPTAVAGFGGIFIDFLCNLLDTYFRRKYCACICQ